MIMFVVALLAGILATVGVCFTIWAIVEKEIPVALSLLVATLMAATILVLSLVQFTENLHTVDQNQLEATINKILLEQKE